MQRKVRQRCRVRKEKRRDRVRSGREAEYGQEEMQRKERKRRRARLGREAE